MYIIIIIFLFTYSSFVNKLLSIKPHLLCQVTKQSEIQKKCTLELPPSSSLLPSLPLSSLLPSLPPSLSPSLPLSPSEQESQ